MDCALQPLVRARKIRAAMLGFAIARRCLNGSVHFEFVIRRYDDQRFGRNSVSKLVSLPGILENMARNGIDQQRLKEAVEFAVQSLGVHARTGCLALPFKEQAKGVPNYGAEEIAAFAVELQGKLVYYNVNSYHDAALGLADLLALPSESFVAYQVSLLLERFGSAALPSGRIFKVKQLCAGPGIRVVITIIKDKSNNNNNIIVSIITK